MTLFRDLAERRVARYFVAYCAAGWATLEVVDQLADNAIFPDWSYPATLALFLCGLPGALVVSWFHGAKGRQEMPRVEKWLLAGVTVFALAVTTVVARSGAASAAAASGPVELEPWQDPSRVAVLYFDAQGGDDAEFLASGLTESLIDELGTVSGIHVVSRNGSRLFRGVEASPDSIGRTLEAGTLVNGSVRQAGDEVRVEVSLVDVETGNQYESTRLQRPRAEIFELQDSLAVTVSEFLRQAVGQQFGEVRLRTGTRVVEAWERVHQAAQLRADANELLEHDELDAASEMLVRADSVLALAEAADPGWVEPVVRRAELAYAQSRLGGMDRRHYEEWLAVGRDHADRALAMDADNAAALDWKATLVYWRYLLGLVENSEEADRLFHEAEGLYEASIAADPDRATALTSLSHLLLAKGEDATANIRAQDAYEADPFLENVDLTLWRIFQSSWNLGDAYAAERACENGERRFPRNFRFKQCRLMMFALPEEEPDLSRMWAAADGFAELSPAPVREINGHRARMFASMALVRANMPDSARAVAISGRAGGSVDPTRELAFLESITRAWLGDEEDAIERLGLYLQANPSVLDTYRENAADRELNWYHEDLLDMPGFRRLVGLN